MAEEVYTFACTVYVVSSDPTSLCPSNIHSLQVYHWTAPLELDPTIYSQGLERILEQGDLQKPNKMGQKTWALLRECWALDPLKRPTMDQVVTRI
jgi:hypothetical protein